MNAQHRPAWVLPTAVTALALLSSVADAAPNGGTVNGTIRLANPAERGEPPVRNRGFVDRVPNPLKPPKPFNPLGDVIVVLEGGPVDADDAKPQGKPQRFFLIGEGFDVPVLPVLAGSNIEIRNKSLGAPALYSPDDAELLERDPISPNGRRLIKKFGPGERVVEIRARDSAHLSARIVAFDSPYFSRVTESGKFTISGVPAGQWTVRVWYGTGWLSNSEATTVEVISKRPVAASLALPARLKMKQAKGE